MCDSRPVCIIYGTVNPQLSEPRLSGCHARARFNEGSKFARDQSSCIRTCIYTCTVVSVDGSSLSIQKRKRAINDKISIIRELETSSHKVITERYGVGMSTCTCISLIRTNIPSILPKGCRITDDSLYVEVANFLV